MVVSHRLGASRRWGHFLPEVPATYGSRRCFTSSDHPLGAGSGLKAEPALTGSDPGSASTPRGVAHSHHPRPEQSRQSARLVLIAAVDHGPKPKRTSLARSKALSSDDTPAHARHRADDVPCTYSTAAYLKLS